MHPSAHSVLTACVVASALGALVMCLLVLRYGFWSADDRAGDAYRRTFVTRMGHAFAGACFGITAILAVVALAVPGAPPVAPSARDEIASDAAEEVAASTEREIAAGRIGGVENEVRELDRRMEAAEATIRQRSTDGGRLTARVEDLERTAALARARRQAGESQQPPPAAPPTAARAAEPPASPSRPGPGIDAGRPRAGTPAPEPGLPRERPTAPPARPEPPSRRTDSYAEAEKALAIEPGGERERTPTVSPRVPRETTPSVETLRRRNAGSVVPNAREAGASAAPARDPDAPYGWDEGIEEARRVGREIKATFTKFRRKVRDLLDD
jgi:hypothetical protein